MTFPKKHLLDLIEQEVSKNRNIPPQVRLPNYPVIKSLIDDLRHFIGSDYCNDPFFLRFVENLHIHIQALYGLFGSSEETDDGIFNSIEESIKEIKKWILCREPAYKDTERTTSKKPTFSQLIAIKLQQENMQLKIKGFQKFLRSLAEESSDINLYLEMIEENRIVPDAWLHDEDNMEIIIYEIEDTHTITRNKLTKLINLWFMLDSEVYYKLRLILTDRYGQNRREIELFHLYDIKLMLWYYNNKKL